MAIHGNKSQNARVRALEDFKDNKITALVATEVAARGLDIKELPHVVNYELPNVPEDYVHRIGRTARAGSTGAAVSLVSPDEVPLLKDIEKLLKRSVEFAPTPKFEIKEGTHVPRAESREAGEYAPHQDPRRRPEHRRGGQGGRSHGGRGGRGGHGHAPRAEAGRASHDAYADLGQSGENRGTQRQDQPARTEGQHRGEQRRGDGHGQQPRRGNGHGGHGGQKQGGHQGQRRDARGHGGHGGGSDRGQRPNGQKGGFARGARSGGGRGKGGSGGGQSGGFSRMN
jgi:ATP-dependent RNA helicase RhlE